MIQYAINAENHADGGWGDQVVWLKTRKFKFFATRAAAGYHVQQQLIRII